MQLMKPSFEILASSITPENFPYSYNENWKKLVEVAGRVCYKSEDKITDDSADKFVEMIAKKGHYPVLEHSWGMMSEPDVFLPSIYIHKYISHGQPFYVGSYRAFKEIEMGFAWESRHQPVPQEAPFRCHAMTVRFIYDRGVSHEKVRHRPMSPSQESTRYCNYAKKDEIAVIEPFFFNRNDRRKNITVPGAYYRSLDNSWTFVDDETYQMNAFDVWFLTCLWTEWGYMTLINEFGRSPQEARDVLPNSLKTEIVVTANITEWQHIFKLRCSEGAHPQMREVMRPLLDTCKIQFPGVFDSITY